MDRQTLTKQLDDFYTHQKLDAAYQFLMEQASLAMEQHDDVLLLFLLNELIGYFRVTAQFVSGNAIAAQILKLIQARHLEKTIDAATSYINIATFYRVQGKYQDALALYLQAQDIYQQALLQDDERYSAFYNNLSLLYQEMGDYTQALSTQQKAIDIIKKLPDCRIEEAISYTNLAQMYFAVSNRQEGEKYLYQAIELFQNYGKDDPHYFAALSALAHHFYLQKNYERSLQIYQDVLERIEKTYGQNKDYQTVSLNIQKIQKEKDHRRMNGLDLCEAFYQTYGQRMINEQFSDIQDQLAVGMFGFGSDCLGYDDEISEDHDFGPGFCLLVPQEIYQRYKVDLQDAYQQLPHEFMGIRRQVSTQGTDRVGVFEIQSFFKHFLKEIPQTLEDWLYADENALLACSNGRLFMDHYGEVSRLREYLRYYPEDIRLKKIARCLAKMAQSGQYNYARCMRRGDEVASQLALFEFIDQTLSLIYLLNKKYKPYYKWSFYGLKDCPILRFVQPLIQKLATLPSQKQHWTKHIHDINRQDEKVVLIEQICQMVVVELKKQNLISGDDVFLETHTQEVMSHIQDSVIRQKHVMEG